MKREPTPYDTVILSIADRLAAVIREATVNTLLQAEKIPTGMLPDEAMPSTVYLLALQSWASRINDVGAIAQEFTGVVGICPMCMTRVIIGIEDLFREVISNEIMAHFLSRTGREELLPGKPTSDDLLESIQMVLYENLSNHD